MSQGWFDSGFLGWWRHPSCQITGQWMSQGWLGSGFLGWWRHPSCQITGQWMLRERFLINFAAGRGIHFAKYQGSGCCPTASPVQNKNSHQSSNKLVKSASFLIYGAATQTRTADLILTKDTLYLLSHSSII